jgi:hypothetical protein
VARDINGWRPSDPEKAWKQINEPLQGSNSLNQSRTYCDGCSSAGNMRKHIVRFVFRVTAFKDAEKARETVVNQYNPKAYPGSPAAPAQARNGCRWW